MDPRSSPPPATPNETSTVPCVIDIEASGFGRGSFPIEVGVALPDGAALCTLVRPPAHWTHWDDAAARLHGLSRELLERHGRSPREVAEMLNQRLRGATLYCDSWAHDYTWLAVLYDEAGLAPSFTLRHLHELLDEASAARWDEACQRARTDLQVGRHRASTDARVLQQALMDLCPPGRHRRRGRPD